MSQEDWPTKAYCQDLLEPYADIYDIEIKPFAEYILHLLDERKKAKDRIGALADAWAEGYNRRATVHKWKKSGIVMVPDPEPVNPYRPARKFTTCPVCNVGWDNWTYKQCPGCDGTLPPPEDAPKKEQS